MMSVQVYGIPTCGTCKKALQWLNTQGIDYEFINTKEQPPQPQVIAAWVKSLGYQSMRNTSGQSYRALGETKNTWNEEQWISAFNNDPMLLKRPLFVKDGRAIAVGFRDPEAILTQLSNL
jgi:arsenate reductase